MKPSLNYSVAFGFNQKGTAFVVKIDRLVEHLLKDPEIKLRTRRYSKLQNTEIENSLLRAKGLNGVTFILRIPNWEMKIASFFLSDTSEF